MTKVTDDWLCERLRDQQPNAENEAIEYNPLWTEAADRIEELGAEIEAVAKDAERYRWLRHGDNDELVIGYMLIAGKAYLLRDEQLDTAIDAALEALKP